MPEPTVLNPDAASRILLFVDHASNHVPKEFDALGLRQDALEEHIGWDIGTATLAHGLAKRLTLPTVLAAVSRLVVDTNRDPSDALAVPEYSDSILIPGNLGLPFELRRERFERYHAPFHDACARLIIDALRRDIEPILIGLHSFTPKMRGEEPRPWEVGIMWGHDDSLAAPLVEFFKSRGLEVGENEPYSGQPPGSAFYTMARHGAVNRLPHTQIEVRNDQIADHEGLARWTDLLAEAFGRLDDSLQTEPEDATIRTGAEDPTIRIEDEDKTIRIEDEDKTIRAEDEDKTIRIEDEDKTIRIEDEDKTIRAENEDEDEVGPPYGQQDPDRD